jgi:hypothetical protein
MKRIWMTSVLLLAFELIIPNAGPSKAADVTGTNAMPAHIQNLMETEGYAMKPSALSVAMQNTNSQRNIRLVARTQFTPFELSKKKARWNLWDNSSIRHVGRTEAPINSFSPPFAQYEYDITYSFDF